MNSAEYVDKLIQDLKAQGKVLSDVAWQAALACIDWAYVYGARGQKCTPTYRRSAFNAHGQDHPTIKSKCKNFDGTGSCSGCKWFPNGKRTRVFDCRGFTYWILKAVYGWELVGAGATSQWNTESNWKAKGEIGTMPQNTLCCLFVKKNNKMSHTGFGLNNETVECSNGVQYFSKRNKKWTHWAVPVVVGGEQPVPTPEPTPDKGYAIVTGKNLALRQGPGTQYSVMTRIKTGTKIQLVDEPEGWTFVKYGNREGFVMDKYIQKG